MLTITIIAVGKLKEAWMREGCQQYLKRLGIWAQVKVVEVEEYRTPSLPSEAQINECLEKEGQRLKSKIPKGATVIAMCIEGKQFSSVALARYFAEKAANGAGSFAFLIGGSFGLWKELKEKADLCLSMSEMTFPHQLARVMLLEQIYRAAGINANSKYHK